MDKDKLKVYNENHMQNCNVIMGDQYGGIFPLPGAHVTINQQYGKGQLPKQEVKEGQVERTEEREKRKQNVMKNITDLFDFGDGNLGTDNQGRRITNERIRILFRKSFGVGSHPSAQNKIVMEQLWVLLMDNRNQCFKQPDEDFYRQTVLNIIGYFAGEGVVCGQPREIAQCVFRNADTNIAKNVSRGIASPVFPERTVDVLDYYINQLMNGDF